MTDRRSSALRLVAGVLVIAAVAVLAGCGSLGGDQNTFNPAGEVADKQRDLFFIVLWPAVVILALVFLALVYILFRYRRRGDEMPKQIHGNTRLEIAWTIAPAALLIVIAVPTVMGVIELGRAPAADALHVRVIGFQWDWRFEYLDPEYQTEDGAPLSVDELHIPVGREIGLDLEALDVIHSFWVPRLAGKQDLIPGRTNRMWLKADEPGVFRGQCAEFCGIGHAGMLMNVVAEDEEDFDAWIDEQLGGDTEAAAGQ